MLPSKLSKLIFLTLLFILTAILALYVVVPRFHTIIGEQIDKITRIFIREPGTEERSLFEDVVANKPYEPEENQAAIAFYNFLMDSKAFSPNQNDSYWQNWDYKTSFFQGDVLFVDYEKKTADIKVDLPKSLGELNNVPVLCEPQNTASFLQNNLVIQDTNFNIFDQLESTDVLFGQCQDEKCSSIGGNCIILKRLLVNE